MHNQYILTAISALMVCLLVTGCTESGDSTTQDAASSIAVESSQTEDSLLEEEAAAISQTEDQAEQANDAAETEEDETTVTSQTEDQTEQADETVETEEESEAITSDAAEKIALDHLGIDREDVKYIHSYEEHDGGTMVAWCVEFEVQNTQYNYYVDMATGEILRVYEETHN